MRVGRRPPACASARPRWQATARWGAILAYGRGGGNGVMRRGAGEGPEPRPAKRAMEHGGGRRGRHRARPFAAARVSDCRLASLFARPGTHDEEAESAWFGLTDLGADYGAVLVRMSLDGTPVDFTNKLVDIASVG